MITLKRLNEIEIFKSVKSDTLKYVLESSKIIELTKGEHIFRDKEEISNVYFLIEGKISIYKISDNGQKRVIFILDKGKLLNEFSIENTTASANGEAFEDSIILSINKNDLLEFMKIDFEFMKNIVSALSIKVRRMYRQLKNATATIKVEKRIAAKLWKLCRDYGVPIGEGAALINLDISNTYLANLLGVQRETVSRSLKILTELKLIRCKNKQIIVLDPEKLSNYFKSM